MLRNHDLYIKLDGKWFRLYRGNQKSHMERYADGLRKQGKEVKIISQSRVAATKQKLAYRLLKSFEERKRNASRA